MRVLGKNTLKILQDFISGRMSRSSHWKTKLRKKGERESNTKMNQLLTGLVLIVILVVKTGGAESNSETENCIDKNNHYIILI